MIIPIESTYSFFLKKVRAQKEYLVLGVKFCSGEVPISSHSGDIFHYVQQFLVTFFHKKMCTSFPQRKLLLHADQILIPTLK